MLLPSFTSEPVIDKDDIFCTEQNGARNFTIKVIQTLDVTNQVSMLFIYVNTIDNILSLYQ